MTTMLYQLDQAHSDTVLPLQLAARAAEPQVVADRGPASVRRRLRSTAPPAPDARVSGLTHRFGAHGQRRGAGSRAGNAANALGGLLRFEKDPVPADPKVLVVAPMSGHVGILLRETVRALLADHDVHITDWSNARDAPMACRRFGLGEYIELVTRLLDHLGPARVVAPCQPWPTRVQTGVGPCGAFSGWRRIREI